ncbi:hypothetical protein [Spiroplasma citri]|uniref:hypothetical protein n=1 Tax=Spiroplasma citri TaxID=2133 RepID=UPI00148B2D2B|nr:hypothetical protein [Spiroplasma citri]QJU62440.1 hypothetical protein HHA36_09395 [Spiroplasma citri]
MKKNINEILKKIEIKNIIDGDNNILGQTNNHQTILLNKKGFILCVWKNNKYWMTQRTIYNQ